MKTVVTKSYLSAQNNEILLVSVENGKNKIGFCNTETVYRGRGWYMHEGMFYVGKNPVLKVTSQGNDSDKQDKMIVYKNTSTIDAEVELILHDVFHRYFDEDMRDVCLDPLLELLKSGLYLVYFTKVYPTDGAGSFFWGAYNVNHEVKGTARINGSLGVDKPYTPCFLVPSKSPTTFEPVKFQANLERLKNGSELHGIAYHLSGFHSVLLKGHHEAAANLDKNKEFYCLMIEPLNRPYRQEVDDKAEKKEGITGFSGVSVSLPLEYIPHDMLENLLLSRRDERPEIYNTLKSKLYAKSRLREKSIMPKSLNEKSESLPDVEMVQSAKAVGYLSPGQLEALLTGRVDYEGEIIISVNYYQSIMTACNYLQYRDFDEFIEFALNIMSNRDLVAVHEYLSGRLLKIHHKKIFDFFSNILAERSIELKHLEVGAQKYVNRYKAKEKAKENTKQKRNFII